MWGIQGFCPNPGCILQDGYVFKGMLSISIQILVNCISVKESFQLDRNFDFAFMAKVYQGLFILGWPSENQVSVLFHILLPAGKVGGLVSLQYYQIMKNINLTTKVPGLHSGVAQNISWHKDPDPITVLSCSTWAGGDFCRIQPINPNQKILQDQKHLE